MFPEKAPEKPLLVSSRRARELLDIGNTKYWRLVKDGTIKTVEVGGRRMPTYASVEAIAQPAGVKSSM